MRKRRAVKRDVLADPVYNNKTVTKLNERRKKRNSTNYSL